MYNLCKHATNLVINSSSKLTISQNSSASFKFRTQLIWWRYMIDLPKSDEKDTYYYKLLKRHLPKILGTFQQNTQLPTKLTNANRAKELHAKNNADQVSLYTRARTHTRSHKNTLFSTGCRSLLITVDLRKRMKVKRWGRSWFIDCR